MLTKICCIDYYKDFDSESCLPCIGSFGPNCSSPCPDGFFGHGCRQICDCNDSMICDPSHGCVTKKNENTPGKTTPGETYIAIAIPCFLFALFGMLLYLVLKRRKGMSPFKDCCPCRDETGSEMGRKATGVVINDYETYCK
uniref:Multiple epidermal growth factor-like domains protein 10 n=1 Tax=Crassostrea virginica TaxID=6565 RepID=A0A8B8C5N5_CRAVI|nr:multiple epidermal growth factor-like domains protein 10 [Crassostrea virginica]